MRKFILLATLSAQGVQTLQVTPERLLEVNREIEDLGGRVLDQYKALGNEAGAYTQILHLLAFAYLGTFLIHHLLAPRFEPVELKRA